ncbi:IS607 family element RNA-guided endonuclease TnpB [Actinopolyspora halophila]|uniref:IS607 family element RNA-guided endonuclease TnpB n=1 Tax=Actinopolyspora halophila TaxID=1850 RepID=UPI0003826965|nr:IS607 family element RNA-guided endonuclease TnpB [Actinopolyspora halophila]
MATVVQAYQFALDPTEHQRAMLSSHCGAARFAYNWGLGRMKAVLDQRSAERSYGIVEDELTPSWNWSAYSLRKAFNAVKGEVAPWWGENSKEAYASGLANLSRALDNWNKSRAGKRGGRALGFPRFKSKRSTWSFRVSTGSFGLSDVDRRHVRLPRIGLVRTHESTRKLARHVERGTARIRSATVSFRRGRWHVSFSVEIERSEPASATCGGTVGVDLGVKHLAVLSTGEVIVNPKHLEVAQRELLRLQRQAARRCGPDRRTERKASNRWRRTQVRIATLYTAIANARRDGLHKLSTRLVDEFDTIVVEDLHVAGMVRNRRLARSIADVGMSELRRQLDYKTTWSHRQLVVADRFYPSSKTCHGCGTVKAKLRLSQRVFTCDHCGHTADRDLNAAATSRAWRPPTVGGRRKTSPLETHVRPAMLATGTATGRPRPAGPGPTLRRKATAQEHFRTFPERINDISDDATAAQLIEGYKQLVRRAHRDGMRVLGGTLTQFEGSVVWTPERERTRQRVNAWIRGTELFDGVVDFAAATAQPEDPLRLRPEYDSGDGLHPNDAGARAMAEAVELSALHRRHH